MDLESLDAGDWIALATAIGCTVSVILGCVYAVAVFRTTTTFALTQIKETTTELGKQIGGLAEQVAGLNGKHNEHETRISVIEASCSHHLTPIRKNRADNR